MENKHKNINNKKEGNENIASKFSNIKNTMKNNQLVGKIHIIARHGSTNSNGDKMFRGWKETPINQLSEKGKQDVIKLGNDLKNYIKGQNPNDYVIVSSDLNRAKETANKVSEITKIPIGKGYRDLRSQDTGSYSGRKEDDVKPQIQKNVKETPHMPLPGASESYNDFIKRMIKALKTQGEIEKDFPNKKIIVITHHQVEVLHKNNFNKAPEPMFLKGIPPGGFRTIKDNERSLSRILNGIKDMKNKRT